MSAAKSDKSFRVFRSCSGVVVQALHPVLGEVALVSVTEIDPCVAISGANSRLVVTFPCSMTLRSARSYSLMPSAKAALQNRNRFSPSSDDYESAATCRTPPACRR